MSQPAFLLFIVDDDEDDLLFIHNAFMELGLDNVCKGFFTGRDFFDHLKFTAYQEIPDVVILDYELPKMNGKEILKKIRNTPEMESVPVIFYSDKITEEIEKELQELGAFFCIKKGITQGDQMKFAKTVTQFLKK